MIQDSSHRTTNGRVRTKVPRSDALTFKIFSLGKNKATRKNIQPIKVPALLKRSKFFLPYVSDHLPKIGAPMSWNAGYIADKNTKNYCIASEILDQEHYKGQDNTKT